MTLIAEAGNCHFGDLKVAKEMIKVAKDSGADLVKFQAIDPDFVAPFGSMPVEFYKHVAFSVDEYIELIDHGNSMQIPVFFSIFGTGSIRKVAAHTFFHKVSAKQSPTFVFTDFMDKDSTFVSVNPIYGLPHVLQKAKILYATEYLPRFVDFDVLHSLSEHFGDVIGYSDHTVGIQNCVQAVVEHGCDVVEKHFTLTRDFSWEGIPFRDTVHSALPNELEKLAKAMKGK